MDELARYFSNVEEPAEKRPQKQRKNDGKSGSKCPRPASLYLVSDPLLVNSERGYKCHFKPHDDAYCEFCWKKIQGVSVPIRDSLQLWNSGGCSCVSSLMPHQLPPEVEVGNIEYKRKLVNPTPNRFEQLVTQMKWRLNEGGGEAIYRLGVDDDGRVTGLSPKELDSSLATLKRMAERLNAILYPLRERTVTVPLSPNSCQNNSPEAYGAETRKAIELLVRQSPVANHGRPSLCIAVLGGMDAGKSTLIGVLTDGELDNARGRARLNLFRHLHEVQSGRTSSLSSELLGFDVSGNVTNYTRTDGRLTRCSVNELVRNSYQLVTLIDSAGHLKYQRTTLAGLARAQPVGVLLVVSAVTGLTAIGMEHAQLAFTLGLPVAVVISKIDQIITGPERTRQVTAVCRQVAIKFGQLKLASSSLFEENRRSSTRLQPMFFPVSSVSGEGIDKLVQFLGRLGRSPSPAPSQSLVLPDTPVPDPDSNSGNLTKTTDECTKILGQKANLFVNSVNQALEDILKARTSKFMCFWVCEVFTSVPGVPDPVLFGIVRSGQLTNGHLAWLGPDHLGQFHLVEIRSLQHNRQPYSEIIAGQTASVAVRFMINVRRSPAVGSVKVPQPLDPDPSKLAGEQAFNLDDSENIPESTNTTFSFPSDDLPPMTLRRGMVLLSNSAWSDNLPNSCQDPIPFKIPHVVSEHPVVGVAWTVEIDVIYRLSIFPGFNASPVVVPPLPLLKQRVALYSGCVAQPALVSMEAEVGKPSDKANHLRVRFSRHPEYLEVGRQVIMTWAGCAKAVGTIVGLHDLVPSSFTADSYELWLDSQARLTRLNMSEPMELSESVLEDAIDLHLSKVPQEGDATAPIDPLQFQFDITEDEPLQEPKSDSVFASETSPTIGLTSDDVHTCDPQVPSTDHTVPVTEKKEERCSTTDKPRSSSPTVTVSDPDLLSLNSQGVIDIRPSIKLDPSVQQPTHRSRRRRKRT